MSIEAWVLSKIAEKVFSYVLDQGQNRALSWARDKSGREPKQQAFQRALHVAFERFESEHSYWVAELFNESFLEKEGAPILAEFLSHNGYPDPYKLATFWAKYVPYDKRSKRTRVVEPVAIDFLEYLAQAFKNELEQSKLKDSPGSTQILSNLETISHELTVAHARHNYLHWMIEQNLYLDARGTLQTQRQVQVKLDEVYISLRAQHERTPGTADRSLLEHEMAQLEAKMASAPMRAEAIEDRREHLLARMESRLVDKNVAGEVLELAEVVKRNDHVVILGDPGSGKSTLLRYLALKHAQALYNGRDEAGSDLGVVRFPILIRIADYAEHGIPKGRSLSEFLADYYAMHECPKPGLGDLLAGELNKGNCLVLLDGLDEIVSADDRRKVVERIEDFIRYHDNRPNRFVITSRRAGYRSAPLREAFAHYVVQDMDEAQIRRFLEQWCRAVEAAGTPELSQEAREVVARREIEAIMKAVQNSAGVRRLASNPLLLRTLALIHRTGAQLPQRRIELYKLAADTLARTWRTAQGVPESELVEDKYLTRLLGRLAYWMHENKSTGIATEQEVYRELGQEWARIKGLEWDEDNPDIEIEVKKFLRAVREHTGLFVERAPKRYGFMHLTFEEYYAARYLVARSKARAKLIRKHLHKPRWEEPILLALGFVGLDSPDDAAELVETAILAEGEEAGELGFTPSKYEELLGRDYLFALRCLGDNIPLKPKVMQRLVERLVGELLNGNGCGRFGKYEDELLNRVRYLRESDVTSIMLPYLNAALHSENSVKSYYAAEMLNTLGYISVEVFDVFITALHSKERKICLSAAESLERLGKILGGTTTDLLAVAQEIITLQEDDVDTIWASAQILGHLGHISPEVVTLLLDTLHVKDRDKRWLAVMAFRSLNQVSDEVITDLIASASDEDRMVSSWSAGTLGQLGQISDKVITALINAIHSEDAKTRLGAMESLGWVGRASDEIVNAFLSALQDEDGEVRMTAAWSLGRLGQASVEVATALIEALRDPAHWVRAEAARSLGWLGQASADVLAALIAALHDEDTRTRDYAIGSLGRLGQASSEVVQGLLEALHTEVHDNRYQVAVSLGQLGRVSSEAITVLTDAVYKASSPSVRSDSALLLGELGQDTEGIIKALWNGLQDKRNDVRTACMQALAQLGQRFPDIAETIEKKLVAAIKDSEFDKTDDLGRSGHDYAYEGLWLLVVGGESEGMR